MRARPIWKVLSLLLTLALLAGILSACAAPTPTPAPSKPAAAPAQKPAEKPAATEPIKLRFATEFALGAIATDVVKDWQEAVEKRSNGRVKFESFYGGTLIKAGEGLASVQKGAVDVAMIAMQTYPTQLVLNQVFYALPFSPQSAVVLDKAVNTLYDSTPALKEEFRALNQEMLFLEPGWGYETFNNKPINNVADLKGKKIAISGTYYPKVFEAAGAVPMSLSFVDRAQALQSGVIDAVAVYPTAVVDWGWTGFGKYYTQMGMGNFPWPLVTINLETWKKLPKDIQDIMLDEGKKTTRKAAELTDQREGNEGIATLKSKGIQVVKFTDKDLADWMKVMPEVALMWITDAQKAGRPAAKEVAQKYIKAAEDAGHKWPKSWKLE